eukprot:205834_1
MGDFRSTCAHYVLFILTGLAILATLSQATILYILYYRHDSSLFYLHVSASLLPPFLIYIYLLYGVKVSGDITNPLLPFLIMWTDLKFYFSSDLELGRNALYSFLNTYHSGCCTFLSKIITLLLVVPLIALSSPFLVLFVLLAWSIHMSCTKHVASSNYQLLLLQFPFMVPSFYMYSAMLFILPIQADTSIVLFMIIFWMSSILYLTFFVTCFSIKKQISDLVLLTELLLLFTVLYIALLIDYESYPKLHTLALIMSICSAVTDGCFFKAAPIRDYVQFSQKFNSEFHSFKANDVDSFVDTDKLYCLIHDVIYHQDALENESAVIRLQNKGYEHVQRIKEPHPIHSKECYELQHRFMKMDDAHKKQHIHHLLDNNIYVMNKRNQVSAYRPFVRLFVFVYWVLSFVVAIYPFAWLFHAVFIAVPQLIYLYHYRDMFVVFVMLLYGVTLVKTLRALYSHYDKYQLIGKLKQIPHIADPEQKQELEAMYGKMLVTVDLIQYIEVDATAIVLLYLYGECDADLETGAHQHEMYSTADEEEDELYLDDDDDDEWRGYDMENLL